MKKILNFTKRRPWLCLWLAIGGYFLLFSAITIWKYWQYGYNALDLAIYNQVMFNSAQGRWFEFTFHQSSYLGDHLELLLMALLPIYYFFQHPATLLVLQTAILALSAWPLYLIAKATLKGHWPLLIALLWLLNPFVQNINLFEFHFLPFAIFLVWWAFYFYQRDNFKLFGLFALLSLLVREDVSLFIFMFGVLAALDKRPLKWIVAPTAVSLAWFIVATRMVAHFSSSNAFKFLVYYGWLGNSFSQIVLNFFAKPWLVLKRLFEPGNFLLAPLLFIPLGLFSVLKPKYLLLALPIFLQIMLSQANNAVLVLKMHYVSLLLPPVFIALIFFIKHLQSGNLTAQFSLYLKRNWAGVKLVLLVSALYSMLAIGPLPGLAAKLFKPTYPPEAKLLRQELLAEVAAGDSVAATYELITNLSSRAKIYSLHYAFIGKTQLTTNNYQLPEDVNVLVFDFDDLLGYQVQFPNNGLWKKYYSEGDENLRELIFGRGFKAERVVDTLVLFKKSGAAGQTLYQLNPPTEEIAKRQNVDLGGVLNLAGLTNPDAPQTNGWQIDPAAGELRILPVALYFKTKQKTDKNYQFYLTLKNDQGEIVHQKMYPLAYGLYPTTEWQPGELVKSNYWFMLPGKLPTGAYQLEAQLLNYQGSFVLDGQRSTMIKISEKQKLGPELDLGEVKIK